VIAPFEVVIDTREQTPWTFENLEGRLYVLCSRKTLKTGDYSIAGYEELVTVERKSLVDLVQSVGHNRDRFQHEHERMRDMGPGNAAVIVEGTWADILENKANTRLSPKAVFRTSLSWFERYGVPWFFFGGRRLAEIAGYRYLEKWYQHNGEKK